MHDKYKEKVEDEALLTMIESGIANSVGDFLNSSDLSRERMKATMEYGMIPQQHLAPQGVSAIVSSDTVEAIEGYSAIIAELMFNNNKIARFIPAGNKPTDYHNAKVASDLVNYTIFKQNRGWEVLNTWVKAALMWKNSIIRWEFIEDFESTFEEYDEISQENLDVLLSDKNVEIVGTLEFDNKLETDEETGEQSYVISYLNARLKRHIDKTRIQIKAVHPEAFRITAGYGLDDAPFIGIQVDMTRSEVRKFWPDVAENIDWDRIGDGQTNWTTAVLSTEQAARKLLVGESTVINRGQDIFGTEANQPLSVTECWLRVDRDGDGIAELKHFIVAGSMILMEEDVDSIPLASLCPFEVPHEFHGLSVADMIRPATLATTAILRGFVENVYLTNYSPKLADPNVVDFSALQNMKPKQIIATNGNPNGAVAALVPDTISQGTVPLLEMLQMHKEQATGLGKAAQGLNDTLFVSGNSEEKMARAMSAAQVRVQFMARRFAETGFKRLVEGIYTTLRTKLRGKSVDYYDNNDFYKQVDPGMLPDNMLMYIDADVGENGNSNTVKKMTMVGTQLLPALKQAGAGGAINPMAAVKLACKTLEALDLDPLDFLVDYTNPEFQEQAEKSRQGEVEAQGKLQQMTEQLAQLDLEQKKATLAFTNVQSANSVSDNVKQMAVSIDKAQQERMKLYIAAAKDGVDITEMMKMTPMMPMERVLALAKQFVESAMLPQKEAPPQGGTPAAMPQEQLAGT